MRARSQRLEMVKPHIAIVTERFLPAVSGLVTSVRNLAESLASTGFDVTLIAPSSGETTQWADGHGIKHISLGRGWLASPGWFWRPVSRRLLQSALTHIDVVHLHSPFFAGLTIAKIARSRKIPIVVTAHVVPQNVLTALRIPWAGKYRWAVRAAWNRIGRAVHLADAVTSPSEYGARLIEKELGRTGVHVVSNGVAIASNANSLIGKGKLSDPIRALFVGRLSREKNVEEILYAVKACRDAQIGICLTVVGAGPDRSRLASICRELEIVKFVEFTGALSEHQLNQRFRDSHFFWIAGRFELECCAALEAMACARAVLAANAGALPTTVAEGQAGRLYEPGAILEIVEHIADLKNNPEAYFEMCRGALRSARTLSLEKTRDRFIEIYVALHSARCGIFQSEPTGLFPFGGRPVAYEHQALRDEDRQLV